MLTGKELTEKADGIVPRKIPLSPAPSDRPRPARLPRGRLPASPLARSTFIARHAAWQREGVPCCLAISPSLVPGPRLAIFKSVNCNGARCISPSVTSSLRTAGQEREGAVKCMKPEVTLCASCRGLRSVPRSPERRSCGVKPGRWSLWTRAERIADFCLNTTCVQISAHIYLQLSEICASQTTVVTEKHTGDRVRGQHSRIQGLWKHEMRMNVLQERRALA